MSPSLYRAKRSRRTSYLTSNLAPISKPLRVNQQIRTSEVLLIDENNQPLGVVPTSKALALAQERGLDLVEVSPLAQPPVCRLLDYGKYAYQLEKQGRKSKSKQKKVGLKGIRLTLKIGAHDAEVRKAKTLEFLAEGHKVKLELILRGRENAFKPKAREKLEAFIADLGEGVTVEQRVSILGNRVTSIVSR